MVRTSHLDTWTLAYLHSWTLVVGLTSEQSSLPLGWSEQMSHTHGKPYYFNEYTGEARWKKPRPAAPLDKDGPKGKVRASHILAKHIGSRKPKARGRNVTRSLDEAQAKVAAIRADVVAGKMTFYEAAAAHSDCSSNKRGGDVGEFTRATMQKAFSDAAFSLEIGELSDPIVSDSGVHIIVRTA